MEVEQTAKHDDAKLTNILDDSEKIKKIKTLVKLIEQKSISFGSMRKILKENKSILDEFIKKLKLKSLLHIKDNLPMKHTKLY